MKDITDWISVIVSVTAIIITLIDRRSKNKELKNAQEKADRAIRIAEGGIQLEMRNSISLARTHLNNVIKEREFFKHKFPNSTSEVMGKLFYSALEDLLNQYERGCMLYIDNNIDKTRFKIEYSNEIRNLVEKGEYKEKYFPAHTSKYKAILKIYNEWENLER